MIVLFAGFVIVQVASITLWRPLAVAGSARQATVFLCKGVLAVEVGGDGHAVPGQLAVQPGIVPLQFDVPERRAISSYRDASPGFDGVGNA